MPTISQSPFQKHRGILCLRRDHQTIPFKIIARGISPPNMFVIQKMCTSMHDVHVLLPSYVT